MGAKREIEGSGRILKPAEAVMGIELSGRHILGVHQQGITTDGLAHLQATLHGKAKQQGTKSLAPAAQFTGQSTHAEAGNRVGRKRGGIIRLEGGPLHLTRRKGVKAEDLGGISDVHQHEGFPEATAAVLASRPEALGRLIETATFVASTVTFVTPTSDTLVAVACSVVQISAFAA